MNDATATTTNRKMGALNNIVMLAVFHRSFPYQNKSLATTK